METAQLPVEALPEGGEIDDDAVMAAFMDALDDIADNTLANAVSDVDKEISNRILGLFDTASAYYEEDMTKSIMLVNALAARLSQKACGGHDHASEALQAVKDKYGRSDESSKKHEDDDAKGDSSGCQQCNAGKPCAKHTSRRGIWALAA